MRPSAAWVVVFPLLALVVPMPMVSFHVRQRQMGGKGLSSDAGSLKKMSS